MSQDTASAAAASSPDNAPAADRLVPAGNVGDPWPPDDRAPDVPDDWPPDPLDEEWEDWLEAQSPRPPEALPAGLLPRDCGDGPGFAAGGVADQLAPDVALAGFARDAWADGLDRLSDDELIGVLRAWRRLNSWTAAGELAAVTELNDRRIAQVAAGADPHLAEHVDDELAVSLTLTARSADALLEFACGLARLPLTRAALAAGEIDRAKALVITEEVGCLDDAHAAAVEAAVIGRAPRQTTGRLRAATKRAVLGVDPAAVRKRRDRAQQEARVEVWDEHSGTAALAGRDLPPADVLAADKRINALAKHLKSAGLDGTLDQLRARVYTALLLGQPVESLEPPDTEHPDTERPGSERPGSDRPGSQPPRDERGVGQPPDGGPGGGVSQPTERSCGESPGADSQGSGPGGGGPGGGGPGRGGYQQREPEADELRPRDAHPDRTWSTEARPARTRSSEAQPGGTRSREAQPARTRSSEAQPGGTQRGETQSHVSRSSEARRGDSRSTESPAASPGERAGFGGPALTGSVNLTLPLTTWLGATQEPGDAAGFGPIPADDARALVDLVASQPAARWCLTLTDRDGRAIGHGCARAGPERRRSGRGGAGPDDDWALTVTVRPLAIDGCAHQRETAGYRPSPSLHHVIDVRHRTCSFPGCRRPAAQCDQDHTVPYDQGGRTCECNLACLCRRHHRAKQAQGWQLDQPEPGVLLWTLPHGRSYRVEPTGYPIPDQ